MALGSSVVPDERAGQRPGRSWVPASSVVAAARVRPVRRAWTVVGPAQRAGVLRGRSWRGARAGRGAARGPRRREAAACLTAAPGPSRPCVGACVLGVLPSRRCAASTAAREDDGPSAGAATAPRRGARRPTAPARPLPQPRAPRPRHGRVAPAPLRRRPAPPHGAALRPRRTSPAAAGSACSAAAASRPATAPTVFAPDLAASDALARHAASRAARGSRPTARYGAVTLFVSGHAYADPGTVLDADDADRHARRAQDRRPRAASPSSAAASRSRAVDVNFWGVTFAARQRHASTRRWPRAARPT